MQRFCPSLIALWIIAFVYHGRLEEFRPFIWNDQTAYWSMIRSFSLYGFSSGYYVMDQSLAPAQFSHFGINSPVFIYFYGALAKLTGWSPQFPLVVNFCLIGLSIFILIRSLRLNLVQIIFVTITSILLWPILIYLPTSSQEPLHQSIGILMAAIFFILLREDKPPSRILIPLFIIFTIAAAMIRLSWILVLFPILYCSFKIKDPYHSLLAIGLGLILFIGTILATAGLIPQSNYSVFTMINNASNQGTSGIINYALGQIIYLAKQWNPLNRIMVIEVVFVIVWNILDLVLTAKKSRLPLDRVLRTRPILNIFNLSSLLVSGFVAYNSEGFHRIFLPIVLTTMLLQVARKEYKMVFTLLVFNLVFFSFYLPAFSKWNVNFQPDPPSIVQSKVTIAANVTFQSDAPNPWCNTVILPVENYDYRVALFPPGIGVSMVNQEYMHNNPLRSKYLLLDLDDQMSIPGSGTFQLLASIPEGNLYLNREIGCMPIAK